MRSPAMRFLIVGLLACLMFIPLFFVGEIIGERADYQRETSFQISSDWGGAQRIVGPALVIPVEGPVTRTVDRTVTDPDTGEETTETVEVTRIERKAPVYLLPEALDAEIATETQVRQRGIFRVPVFTADSSFAFEFDTDRAPPAIGAGDKLVWEEARLIVGLSSVRALRGRAALTVADGSRLELDPLVGDQTGIAADTGDPRGLGRMTLDLGFNGAGDLMIAPVGRETRVTMRSDWADPSFGGAFLPDARDVTEEGFEATWTIPHLARTLPQVSRENFLAYQAGEAAFGVSFYQPNDLYQKSYRAARYGILFIALTFLTVLLIDSRSEKPVHPVQYVFVGLAQSIFVLLLAAYAEQIGFTPAYLVATAAVVGLLTLYGFVGMKLGRRGWALSGLLIVLYAVLYLVLVSTDYALLAGATLAFAALAGTMFLTRNENWGGDGFSGAGGLLRWMVSAAPPPLPPRPAEG